MPVGVLTCGDAFEIAGLIIERIVVEVVYLVAGWDWTIVVLPDFLVQSTHSPCAVSAVGRVVDSRLPPIGMRVPPIRDAVEVNNVDPGHSWSALTHSPSTKNG